jgi:hypothetical protein
VPAVTAPAPASSRPRPVPGVGGQQEYHPGQAEDRFQVLDLASRVSVPYKSLGLYGQRPCLTFGGNALRQWSLTFSQR